MIAYNSSVYNPTLHILNSGKIYMVKLCTELFYSILPTCFLLICYPYILLCFLILFMSLSFSSKCMLELKFAIYHRAAVYPHRLPQRCMQYWLKNRRQSLFKH